MVSSYSPNTSSASCRSTAHMSLYLRQGARASACKRGLPDPDRPYPLAGPARLQAAAAYRTKARKEAGTHTHMQTNARAQTRLARAQKASVTEGSCTLLAAPCIR